MTTRPSEITQRADDSWGRTGSDPLLQRGAPRAATRHHVTYLHWLCPQGHCHHLLLLPGLLSQQDPAQYSITSGYEKSYTCVNPYSYSPKLIMLALLY